MDQQVNQVNSDESEPKGTSVDFKNTEVAFSNKSNKELKKMEWLFGMMNKPFLVNTGSKLALWAVKLRLPFADYAVKNTVFEQFCGGDTLLHCQKSIDRLYKENVLTILDYGAEGKTSEDELDAVKDENIRAIEMAASNNSVPCITIKLTGLVENEVLEALQENKELTTGQKAKFDRCYHRLDEVCAKAHKHGVAVLMDAEESWIQNPIDQIALEMMGKYNKEKVIVFNTYQLYQHAKLDQLMKDHNDVKAKGLLFGAKLVRGAYMEKENKRAIEMNYPTPIQPNKPSTDKDFDAAVSYCLANHETVSFINATHNLLSTQRLLSQIEEQGIDGSHPHINFSQLYGMSDYITFNLADGGYNVAKYVPYGPVKEVIPYLIRRAQENTSVTGEVGRELSLVRQEVQRRGI